MGGISAFRVGMLAAVSAHVMWGMLPLYWKQVEHIPSDQLVSHRFLWSFVVLTIMIPVIRRYQADDRLDRQPTFAAVLSSGRLLAVHALAALLLSVNSFSFLWAVSHDAVLEASLGYYINPLFNVLLGVLILGERLLAIQWVALSFAAAGVGVMTAATGTVPLVALAMATSFACYGLVKKRTPLAALPGLWLEMGTLAPVALAILIRADSSTAGSPSTLDVISWAYLVGGGLVTVMPLMLFAVAAQRVPLSLIGVLQYIGPTLQFLVGAVVYREPLDEWRLLGFVLVWCGVGLYLQTSARNAFSRRAKAVS